MAERIAVVDSSVAVKWFVPEAGRDEAMALLRGRASGKLTIAAPDLLVYEVLGVVRRRQGAAGAAAASRRLAGFELTVIPPDARLVAAALEQSDALGCDLYDAFFAGLASLLEAPLYSADRRAHGGFPGVVLVGAEG